MKLEQMISARTFVLQGPVISIQIYANTPCNIPRDMVKMAIEKGMAFADNATRDEKVTQVFTAPVLPAVPQSSADREDMMYLIFEDMIERNDASDFAASGVPSHIAVSARAGFKVAQKEVATCWAKMKTEQEEKANAQAAAALVPPTKGE